MKNCGIDGWEVVYTVYFWAGRRWGMAWVRMVNGLTGKILALLFRCFEVFGLEHEGRGWERSIW